jgi:transcriptional regulator with XRE-family HTH domain
MIGHSPDRADYDWRGFSRALKVRHRGETRGIRAIADEIGVTASDMSRAMGGQIVSVGKVIALCQWIGVPVERFYIAPDKSIETDCCSRPNVKRDGLKEGLGA